MDLKTFKAGLKQRKELTLVGPLTNSVPLFLSHIPQILVDGGTKIKKRHPLHFSVGDGDSTGRKLDLKVSPDKDYSDLVLALSLVPKEIKKLHLVGFWGGRQDHELINLAEIHQFLMKKKQTEVHFLAKQKTLIWALSKGQFRFVHTGSFSLFCFKNSKVHMKGKCEYTMKGATLRPLSSHGLSNIAFGAVEIKITSPLLVIFPSPSSRGP